VKLLTVGNPKILKGTAFGYLTAILHFIPSRLSGFNVCPMASKACTAACLNTAGRGGMNKIGETTNYVQTARKARTLFYFNDRDKFMAQLVREVKSVVDLAAKHGLKPAIRLNGTSDIRWELEKVNYGGNVFQNIMLAFPNVIFYDYTKIPNRRNLPPNYTLTFSRSESNEGQTIEALANGMNIAVVFRKGPARVKNVYSLAEQLANRDAREAAKLNRGDAPRKPYVPRKVDLSWVPATFLGVPTFHGDESDLRFLDPKRVVVALTAKGEAKYDTSGFVVSVIVPPKVKKDSTGFVRN